MSRMTAVDVLRNLDTISGSDLIRKMIHTRALNGISGAEVLRSLDPLSEGLLSKTLDRIAGK